MHCKGDEPVKKTAILCMLTLALGFLVGAFCNSNFAFLGQAPRGMYPNDSTRSVSAGDQPMLPVTAAQETAAPSPDDSALLLRRSWDVLDALKSRNYTTLSQLVHPDEGLTFTPFSTVDRESNLSFTPDQIASFPGDSTRYVWGITSGQGTPLDLSVSDYFDRYVFNTDYTKSPQIGIDSVLRAGNALENVSDVYSGARFVEFHYPGLDPKNEGYDWCSLKLVFSWRENDWRLIGVIHSEWTT